MPTPPVPTVAITVPAPYANWLSLSTTQFALNEPGERSSRRIVVVVLLAIQTGKGGKPVWQALDVVIDLPVTHRVLVVARYQLEWVGTTDTGLHKVAPVGL